MNPLVSGLWTCDDEEFFEVCKIVTSRLDALELLGAPAAEARFRNFVSSNASAYCFANAACDAIRWRLHGKYRALGRL